jgi:hypothetical protein
MRFVLPRWILLFLVITLILSFPLISANAVQGNTWLEGPYPTPYIEPNLETDTASAQWLIVGALVIVVIIFGGVALRRRKS